MDLWRDVLARSSLRAGCAVLAVTVAADSPDLLDHAGRIFRAWRGRIAELYGAEHAELAVLLNDVRGWAKATLPTYADRRDFFEGIVNGEPDPIALLRAGDRAGVERLIAGRRARAEAALAGTSAAPAS